MYKDTKRKAGRIEPAEDRWTINCLLINKIYFWFISFKSWIHFTVVIDICIFKLGDISIRFVSKVPNLGTYFFSLCVFLFILCESNKYILIIIFFLSKLLPNSVPQQLHILSLSYKNQYQKKTNKTHTKSLCPVSIGQRLLGIGPALECVW